MEGSVLCGMRSLAENCGVPITLAEIEKCAVVDVPVEGKGFRGTLNRYYIYNNHDKVIRYVQWSYYKSTVGVDLGGFLVKP